jgi:phosphoribosylglycinamide formyltransferase 1
MLTPHHPLRVAVLCSRRAPGLLYLLNQSPDRGAAYEIVGCATNQVSFEDSDRVERRGVPTVSHPIRGFYADRGAADLRDMTLRAEYDAAMLALIEPWMPDLILLDGYLHLVTEPILRRFRNRVLNLHFSDLMLRTYTGTPRYPGVRAVRDALHAGCAETRATVHLVDEEPDGGPPIVGSWPFPVSPLVDDLRTESNGAPFKAYVFAHEQWMLRTVSGPLVAAALRLIASGAVDLNALAAGDRRSNSPWLLDRHGFLLAPEVDCVPGR